MKFYQHCGEATFQVFTFLKTKVPKAIVVASMVAEFYSNGFAQNDLKDIPTPDPAAELAAMQIDSAVEVNLFAADPLISKPIHSNFDSQGRLWLATSSIYPQLAPGEVADDKVLVVTDKDGDGVADESTTFASGLLIPTGVLPDYRADGKQACYVAASTQLLYFLDTDGDGKADQRRVIYSGFGTEDTHHLLHTLRWGPDGCIYLNQSIYIHSHIETPYGVKTLEGGGIWRLNPKTLQLDIVCKGFVNPWGHIIDRHGQSFATDGAYNEGINHVFPGSVFVTSPGEERWLSGMNSGSPKHCGLELLGHSAIPTDFRNHLITSDFRSHRVNRFSLDRTDSGYRSTQHADLIRTSHVAFRPIDTKLGPDGALYISDWYNPVIQHGEVDFRDPRRDRTHGRVWRVRWKDAERYPLAQDQALTTLSETTLISKLRQDNVSNATWLRQELSRRDVDKVDRLLADEIKTSKESRSKDELIQLRCEIEAHRNQLSRQSIDALFVSEFAESRALAVRFFSNYQLATSSETDVETFLNTAIHDDDWLVQLEAVAALRRWPSEKAVPLALYATRSIANTEIDFSLWKFFRERQTQTIENFQKLIATRTDPYSVDDMKPWIYAIQSSKSGDWSGLLAQAIINNRIDSKIQTSVLELIASKSDAETVGKILIEVVDRIEAQIVSAKTNSPSSSETTLDKLNDAMDGIEAMLRGTTGSKLIPAAASQSIERLVTILQNQNDPSMKETSNWLSRLTKVVARSGSQWKIEPVQKWIESHLFDTSASSTYHQLPEVVDTFIESLGEFNDSGVMDRLKSFAAKSETQFSSRQSVIVAIAKSDLKAASELWSKILSESADKLLLGDTGFVAIASRKGGPEAMQEALQNVQQLPASVAEQLITIAQKNSITKPELLDTIRRIGKLQGQSWKYDDDLLTRVTAAIKSDADPGRGESIYRIANLQCVRCHAIGSGGGNIGPNLQSLGGSSQIDYILQSLIEPDAKLKEGFQTLTLLDDEGRLFTGLLKSRTADRIELLSAEGKQILISKASIEEEKEGKSLMPAGLVDTLTFEQLCDLVAFLSRLGRDSGYTVATEPWIRNWQLLEYSNEGHTKLNRTSIDTIASDDSDLKWGTVTSKVDARLPIAELPTMQPHREVPPFVSVRASFDCKTEGMIRLVFNTGRTAIDTTTPEGIQVWIDSQRWAEPSSRSFFVSAGKHSLVLAINKRDVEQIGVRIEPIKDEKTGKIPLIDVLANEARSNRLFQSRYRAPSRLIAVDRQELFHVGDRVAWLGGKLWEQMSETSVLETLLQLRMPEKELTFRNASWSGDCVDGSARAVFGNVEDGYQRRLKDLEAAKPTLVLIGYGSAEAFDQEWPRERFEKELRRLVSDLLARKWRVALVVPGKFPSNIDYLVDMKRVNQQIESFKEVIESTAAEFKLHVLQSPAIDNSMLENGITLHDEGYMRWSSQFADTIASDPGEFRLPKNISIDTKSMAVQVKDSAKDWNLQFLKDSSNTKAGTFVLEEHFTTGLSTLATNQADRDMYVSISGLQFDRTYALSIDYVPVTSASGKEWNGGVHIDVNGRGLTEKQLRETIIAKENAFFHQYRPQNETYLFLFRKHEQGKNAAETERFAAQAAELDTKIKSLVARTSVSWEIQLEAAQ